MKKLFALLFCLTLAVVLAAGAAADRYTASAPLDTAPGWDPLQVYTQRTFEGGSVTAAGTRLEGENKMAYDDLVVCLEALLDGTYDSDTLFPVLGDRFGGKLWEMTSFDGQLFTFFDPTTGDSFSIDYFVVAQAVYRDHPELCFWTNEMCVIAQSGENIDGTFYANGIFIGYTVGLPYALEGSNNQMLNGVMVSFNVDRNALAAGSAEFARVDTAFANALQIVQAGEGMDDISRMYFYAQCIMDLVVYDQDAADAENSKTDTYFEPWKMVSVFDGDPATNVVCEGYSKAFYYLCSMTSFADPTLEVSCVTGLLGNTWAGDPGDHMWNLVHLQGKNYLVDVTNMVGWGDMLFMSGPSQVQGDWMVFMGSDGVGLIYAYDTYTLAMFPPEMLELVTAEEPEETIFWDLTDGVLTISGTGDMPNFKYTASNDGTTAPWSDDIESIHTIVIEEGITGIGSFAFPNAVRLRSVSLPSTLEAVGSNAFHNCLNLSEVSCPLDDESVFRIRFGSGNNCLLRAWGFVCYLSGTCGDSLTWSVSDDFSVLTISGTGPMYDYGGGSTPWFPLAYNLTAVVFPEGMTTVGSYAFEFCSALTDIELPGSLTDIGMGAFRGCTGIKTVTLSYGLRNVGNGAFYGCSGLSDVTYIGTESMFERNVTIGVGNPPLASARITTMPTSGSGALVIPEGTTSIEPEAFAGVDALTVVLPDGCSSIGSRAFANCPNLRLVFISDETQFPADAFAGCAHGVRIVTPLGVVLEP